jgi:hypothetical protein
MAVGNWRWAGSLSAWGAIAVSAMLMGTGVAAQAQSNPSTTVPSVTSATRFACQFVDGQYTVMYYPESQPDQAYAWAVPTQLGGGWTPERRCTEISRRLETYRPDGLQELSTSVENGYNIVCATTSSNPSCRIVFTVPPGQDPIATRDRVFENLAVADAGQGTAGVSTYAGGDDVGSLLNQIGGALDLNLPSLSGRRRSEGIDLRPFLDRGDGGTGAQLDGGIPTE